MKGQFTTDEVRIGDALHRFPGGLRLRHHKKVSCQVPVRPCPLPERLVLPLLQHRGASTEALVQPGDAVLAGMRIGAPDHAGVYLHASTSGVVEAIEERLIGHPSGQSGPCIVVRADGLDRWVEGQVLLDWDSAPPGALRRLIREAGIVGLGGAAFPTNRKLTSGAETGIHTLVLNGAECEPYIACDEMQMREQPDQIVLGGLILARACGAERVVIAIEDQMGAVREALQQAVTQSGAPNITVRRIQTIYPEGGERQLIQVLTGREVPAGGYPQDLGLLVQNVGTAVAAADAVIAGRPLVERTVTVTGNGVNAPCNLRVRLGTPVAELIAAAGGYADNAARLVVGGPMMGYAIGDDGQPVVKGTNCVLVLTEDDIRPVQDEMPCIRCGECSRVCPAGLMPQSLHFYLRSGQWEEAESWGLNACIECACCDYVCPSHIPLASWFRYGKDEVRERHTARAAAELSRQRYEAREQRLQAQQRERQERLARRKQALADNSGRQQQVADAIARAKAAKSSPGDDS